MTIFSDSDSESCGTLSFFPHTDSHSFGSSVSTSYSTMSNESSPKYRPENGPQIPVWQRRPVNALKLHISQPSLSNSQQTKQHVPSANPGAGLSVLESSQPTSLDYSVVFYDSKGRTVSPLHHVNIHAGKDVWTMVCKTPKGSQVELECSENRETEGVRGSENLNRGEKDKKVCRGCGSGPFRPRIEKGKAVIYSENTLWNIGMLPQTSANPDLPNIEYGGLRYDGRPIELIDIGAKTGRVGEVYAVKVLAAFAVIDWNIETMEQQLSWKVVCVRADDLSSVALDDVGDVNRRMPGVLEEVREWLRICHNKIVEDRPPVFGLNERATNREGALKVIEEAHASWQRLVEQNSHLLLKTSAELKGTLGSSSPLPSTAYPASQGTLWQRITPSSPREYYGGGGGGSLLNSPSRASQKQRKSPWESAGGESDTESQVSGSGYSTTGSVSRRMGLKALRSSPHFAHPAYIEPRGEELAISFESEDWDDVDLKTSALCFPMNHNRKAGMKSVVMVTGGGRRGAGHLGKSMREIGREERGANGERSRREVYDLDETVGLKC